ncbi:protein Atg16l2-like isoform X1 [Takifugu flavidus]|uniref:protein Atg16l2-like isoform X1 n=1 Tax=Takifugu flavidus TaxID=433684 RepID=UPI00254447FD|nr:protein Atg16l2-like isoform X1 [Takifugu flavidus]
MAAGTAANKHTGDSPSSRSRVLHRGGGGVVGETWKSHIIRQLKHRDRSQRARFQDLIGYYTNLLDKTHLSSSQRCSSCDSCSSSSSLPQLKKKTGELACHVVELQRQIKNKDNFLEEQRARLLEEEQQLSGAAADHLRLKDQVKQVRQEMRRLKKKYDSLLEESRLREERVRGQSLKHPVTCTLKDNRHRGPEAAVPIVKTSVTFVRTSVTSPRIFYPILKLFQKKRIHTGDVLEEDQAGSAGFCWSARVPVRALQVLEAHEQGINAVSFSSLDLLATGGTDKVIKLWDITSGSLSHRATLGGSTEGITCIDFSHMGDRILAASYDKSALLWQRGSVTPKLTLTGHSRKVTVARFCTLPHQVATGSADRTIRHWDLHRAACVQVVQVTSYCSDLVCADHLIISGHYDCRIRVWDSRTLSCIQELPVEGKVTSLDISSDHRQLLSCCRDNHLQLLDLRRRSNECTSFRADGFSCGSDSTKAVIRSVLVHFSPSCHGGFTWSGDVSRFASMPSSRVRVRGSGLEGQG